MDVGVRIETALERAIASAGDGNAPPQLESAMRYALFPGGARVRPRLCLEVAKACGDGDPAAANAAAIAIELLHCASLVHDDMPCFDDADYRRGKPSVHLTFGEPIALLAGDALIVSAFQTLARGTAQSPRTLAGLLPIVADAVGMPNGIVAGQAWESEPDPELGDYQRAKTGALFVAATTAGACAAGADPAPWRMLGEHIGEAYQVADDLLDAVANADDSDKPVGRDTALGRPNAVRALGLDGAIARLDGLVTSALASIPPCDGMPELRALVMQQAKRLAPASLARGAA